MMEVSVDVDEGHPYCLNSMLWSCAHGLVPFPS